MERDNKGKTVIQQHLYGNGASSSSSPSMAPTEQHQHHHYPHNNNNRFLSGSSNAAIPSVQLPQVLTRNQSPRFLDPFAEDRSPSIDDAFSRLNLSANSSEFYPPFLDSSAPPALAGAVTGGRLLNGGDSAMDFLLAADPLSLQRRIIELEWQIKIRDEMIEKLWNPICGGSIDGLEGLVDMRRFNRSSVSNNARGNSLNRGNVVVSTGESSSNNRPRKQCCVVADRPVRSYSKGINGRRRNGPVLDLNSTYNHQFIRPLAHYSLEEISGRMVEIAKDPHGCLFLQKKIEEGKSEEIKMIFIELKYDILDLMLNHYGNYLVQKLVDACDEDQREELFYIVTEKQYELSTVCCDIHGTRAVQRLLENLTDPEHIARFVSVLQPYIIRMIMDPNGYHVVLYCVTHFLSESNEFLMEDVVEHCVEIAMNSSGCCVLQQCLNFAQEHIKERLIAEITKSSLLLSQDAYGNYIVQYIVNLKNGHVMDEVLAQLKGSFVSLSKQKFSSNVVERCLKNSTKEQSARIIRELIEDPNALSLFQDLYGNYVIQSALEVSFKGRASIFRVIVDMVEMNHSSLHSNPFGKRVISFINNLTKQHHQQRFGSF